MSDDRFAPFERHESILRDFDDPCFGSSTSLTL
jgi:hypothetical protein